VIGIFVASSIVAGFIGWDVATQSASLNLSPLETTGFELESTWCQSVRLDTELVSSQLAVFSNWPKYIFLYTSLNRTETLSSRGLIYSLWNLKQGSTVNMTTCAMDSINFVIIQGADAFNTFNSGLSPLTGVILNTTYTNCSSPFYPPPETFYSLSIPSSDSYFFIWINKYTTKTTFTWNFEANRIEYDINSTSKCNCTASLSIPCDCDLRYSDRKRLKHMYVILQSGWEITDTVMSPSITQISSPLAISWSCKPRLWFYFLIFGIVGITPPIIVAMILAWCWKHTKKGARLTIAEYEVEEMVVHIDYTPQESLLNNHDQSP